jgi:uncharacterized protein YdhG (YjbR/CyaY superfamily)
VATNSGDRSNYFPAIEKKYGQPMRYWHDVMAELSDWKYPEQIAYLKENHGFSQAHANALVMFSRGSKSSKRFGTLEDYLKPYDTKTKKTVQQIFRTLQTKYPKSEVVISWNQPMLKLNEDYLFGLSVLKNYLLIAPWGEKALKEVLPKITEYKVNKKTIQVPLDWKVEEKFLLNLVKVRVAELKQK